MIIYSIFLSLHYLIEIGLLNLLNNKYDIKKIMINSFFITFLLLLLFFPKQIIFKPTIDYILLIFFSINMLFGLYIWSIAIKKKLLLGKFEAIAIAIYLPILTILSALLLNQKIKIKNFIGILIISIGAYLTLS